MALPKGPAQEQLEKLDAVFGPEYFEHGRLLVTVARDVAGMMKVAHKLQGKLNQNLGSMVEVIFEHIKHELWMKLHEAAGQVGLHKGPEVPECQVTQIPDGVRLNPYQRDSMPTLEVLLLWEDTARRTRGQCLYSMSHPDCPTLEQVDDIFTQIEPYFAKRWVWVQLTMGPPVKGAFEDEITGDILPEARPEDDGYVGAGIGVTILACHAYGFAREQTESAAPHVRHCQPLVFRGISDDAGVARLCFLPAEVNKIQVAETERFHGTEVSLPRGEIKDLDYGPTKVEVKLTPKELAAVAVHVFAMPAKMPRTDEDGIVDWATEEREPAAGATVTIEQLRDGEATIDLRSLDGGETFIAEDGGLPEGCVNIVVRCPGFETEERAVVLLVGYNEFYVPMHREP